MTKLYKANKEFVVGKHQIGWVDPYFTERFGDITFTREKHKLNLFELPKDMTGKEILKKYPNLCALGDVLNYMEENKNWRYFLVKGKGGVFVVCVHWDSGPRKWHVITWLLDYTWSAGNQFASRTDSDSLPLSPSGSLKSLEDRVSKLEKAIEKIADYFISLEKDLKKIRRI